MSSGYVTFEWVDLPENVPKARLAIVQLIYGVPSLLLMASMLVYMGCSKSYSSSFYRLVQMDLLMNIIGWTNSWFAIRFAEFPFGTNYTRFILGYIPWFWNVSIFLYTCMFHVHFWSAMSLSIHRISSILFFQSYERFWSRYYLAVYVVYWLYSPLQNIFTPSKGPQMNLVNGTLWYSIDELGTIKFNLVTNAFCLIYFSALIGMGVAVPIIVDKKFPGAVTDGAISKKLTRIAVTTGFVYSGILFWSLLNALQAAYPILPEEYDKSISFSVLSTVNDMISLALPYILLIFDSNIKRDFLFFRHSRSEVSSSIPVFLTTA